MEEKTIIHKVPVAMLITLLTDLYEQGVDYVDVIGKKDEDVDHLGISVRQGYMADEEAVENLKFPKIDFILEKEPPPPTDTLSEEDLNDLI